MLSSCVLWLSSFNWLNDLWVESCFAFTGTEQGSLILGMKWFIVSEWMLFMACFWSLLNFRLILSGFSLYLSYPILSTYSFAIPLSNLLILVFSSLPIQAAQLFVKSGFLLLSIEGSAQSVSCGLLFIILQCKEFLYSYFSLSDCFIGSIFYLTTGLHGIHVILGCFGWWQILCLILLSPTLPLLIESALSILLCSGYWHFVDCIWLFVFDMMFLSDSFLFYVSDCLLYYITIYNFYL